MKINIVNNSKNPLPEYATEGSAGMDLMAEMPDGSDFAMIPPGQRRLIKTGLHIQLPVGFEAQIRPRSGLALKKGITVLNTPGTIDSDYTGDIGIILFNSTDGMFYVNQGDRIAQMVIAQYEKISWKPVLLLSETERGSGGFGHSGKN